MITAVRTYCANVLKCFSAIGNFEKKTESSKRFQQSGKHFFLNRQPELIESIILKIRTLSKINRSYFLLSAWHVVNTKTLMERNTSGTNRQTNTKRGRQMDRRTKRWSCGHLPWASYNSISPLKMWDRIRQKKQEKTQ